MASEPGRGRAAATLVSDLSCTSHQAGRVTIVEPRPGGPGAPRGTTTAARAARAAPWWARLGTTPHLLALATAAAVMRLPYLGTSLTPDEAGFSIIARQWRPGTSLYGHFWVDRPPLLLELYGLAGHLGTTVGLRLLGCLAAFAATLLVAMCARRACGNIAGFCAGAVAAVGYSSVALGAVPVNGELLAAPFIAASLWCWGESVRRSAPDHLLLAASGGSAAAAVLVKQNMVDGVLFFGVAMILFALWRRPSRRAWGSMVLSWAAGAVAVTSLVLGVAVIRGTSVSGVWYAMYPFRLVAANPIQGASVHAHVVALLRLATLELLSLGPLLLALLALFAVKQRRAVGLDARVLAPAVLALAVYDVFSIAAGGSYWTHYLVELVVPTALAGGLVAANLPRTGRPLVACVVLLSLVSAATGFMHMPRDVGASVGESIGRAADPGDTIVSALGSADIVQASGLSPSYAYLWSLPARTLDPHFRTLGTLLAGPHAPTWLVVRGQNTQSTLLASAAGPVMRSRYRIVATLCGRLVYLLDGTERAAPQPLALCASE